MDLLFFHKQNYNLQIQQTKNYQHKITKNTHHQKVPKIIRTNILKANKFECK